MRKLFLLSFLGLIALTIVGSYRFYVDSLGYARNPESSTPVVVKIEKGETVEQIAETLHEADLIEHPLVFKTYIKRTGEASKLQAGRILLREDMTLKEIVEALVSGKTESFKVTLLEGWTVEQMAEHLDIVGITSKEDFMDCIRVCDFASDLIPTDYLEGYLYPDTYYVDFATYSDQRFIGRLISTLENRLSAEDHATIKKSGRSLEEIMIMASIVEREERNAKEQPTVAGILWNRFDEGAGLGADATVLYALGRTKGGLSYQDLQVESPYNTRKYRGLPPTPIANPSISSIRAAIYPKDTNYWYYLHDPKGGIHYGRTLDEHNANKAKYL